ncbi:diguanylate cyclase [Rhizobium lusitanum]|uniref:Diguanylate cyclase n=1 Tax=Rhizobium lusitanum TaxID=293958 RepID=A0A6L9UHS1_9HYPH|nr:diguanylate cyclase [Rhizobium lusitanum]
MPCDAGSARHPGDGSSQPEADSAADCFRGRLGQSTVECVDRRCLLVFKTVNDRHGHPAGNLLLEEAAQRLKENTRRGTSRSGSAMTSSSYICRARHLPHARLWRHASSNA